MGNSYNFLSLGSSPKYSRELRVYDMRKGEK
jgi:hypothetical protein